MCERNSGDGHGVTGTSVSDIARGTTVSDIAK